MFARDKRIGPYTYVYLVENVREEGRTKQRIIANLGRKEVVVARGDLDRLARSVARLAQRWMVLSVVEGEAPPNAMCRRIGPALLFERRWQEVGCRAVLEELAAQRQFEFAAERATFLTVLHRLFVSGSDRAAEKWRADYRIEGTEALQLHHLYRAMAWLGEPLTDQAGASELAPRCRKDVVEEELFARRRDLFAELSVVFVDTTSLSFEGQGGEELGRRGHSKDYRPDLNQMIVGLVMDQDGRPLCSELWPGNTADVTTLLPVVDRLRARFGVGRICVVADRGMISAATIAALEERKLEYILVGLQPTGLSRGVRERSSAEVRSTVIDDQTPFVPLVVPRASGDLTELEAKQVKIGGRRHIVCRNLAEAGRDAEQRAAILDGLRTKLSQGDKALVGTRRWSATAASAVISRPSRPGTSPSTRHGSPTTRASTGSTYCVPTLRSPHCRSCCATATCCGSSSCCAKPRPCSPPARSTTAATWRSAAMCSALFWRCCSPKNSKIASAGRGLPLNGATSCAISTGCSRSSSSRMASASCCAPPPPVSPVSSFRRLASRCRPIFRKSRCRGLSRLPEPPASLEWC